MFYTYSIKNVETGKFYIGSRTSKCMLTRKPEDDLGVKYFSSSKDKELRQAIKDGKVEYHILQEYDDAKVCYRAEQQLIALYWKVFGKDMSYNHFYSNCNGNKIFSNTGMNHSKETIEKIKQHRKGLNCVENHPLYKIGHKPETIEKIKQTIANKSKEEKQAIREKQKYTLLEKYGVEYISQIPGVGEKISKSKKGKTHVQNSKETKEKISKAQKGKPKPKFYWRTPEGEIKLMNKLSVIRFHKDWELIEDIKKY